MGVYGITDVLGFLQETWCSSGSYVPPANRLLLIGLALSLKAHDILETGTSTGGTAMAFAMTGARVVTIEHDSTDPEVFACAEERLSGYTNVERIHSDALFYMATQPENSFDLIFLDDGHWPGYAYREIGYAQRLVRPGGVLVFHDTLFCHMWEVIEATLPSAWQRINLPSFQDGADYTGTDKVCGQDFGLGIVRKPLMIPDPMMVYEQLPVLREDTPKLPYDIVALHTDTNGCCQYVDSQGIENLVDYYITVLETWRIRPDLVAQERLIEAQKLLYVYGKHCAHRADEAMRRKCERL